MRDALTRTPPRGVYIAALMAATFPGAFSYSAVGVAIPSISAAFGLPQGVVQWVASAFIASMMGGMLLASAMLSRFGLRTGLVVSGLGFAVSSAVGAFADTFTTLVAARFVMGVFGGLMQPLAMVTIYRAYGAAERGRATAVYGVIISLVPTFAPSVAGLLIDLTSWRAIFAAPIPLALCGLLAAKWSPKGDGGGTANADWLGVGALYAALLALLAIDVSHRPSTADALAGGVALAGFALFAWRIAHAPHPLIARDLFASAAFRVAFVVAFLYGTLMFGLTYLVPIFLQQVLGTSATLAGLTQVPAGIALALGVHWSGRVVDRRGFRPVLVAGFVLLALGSACLSSPVLAGTVLLATIWSALGRMGMGAVFAGINTGSTQIVADRLLPEVPGVVNFCRFLGGAIGVKALGVILDAGSRADASYDAAFGYGFLMLAGLAVAALPLVPRMRARRAAASA